MEVFSVDDITVEPINCALDAYSRYSLALNEFYGEQHASELIKDMIAVKTFYRNDCWLIFGLHSTETSYYTTEETPAAIIQSDGTVLYIGSRATRP